MAAFACGCSTVKRVLTVDKDYLTTEAIDSLYHPRALLETRYYACSAIPGPSQRRMMVYLPDNYSSDSDGYPVLYLIHGARGNETSWIKDGGLIAMLDSLRAQGECSEFIVVMPNMNQYDDDSDYGQSRFKKPLESFFEIDGAVESSFVSDVVQFVESNYRVCSDKSHRAIAGLSVGALQSIYISAAYPDMFDYIGLFSPLWQPWPHYGAYSDFYRKLRERQLEQFKDSPKIYSLTVGTMDPLFGHVEDYRYYLNKNNFRYQYEESKGGHNWENWSKYLETFVKIIF